MLATYLEKWLIVIIIRFHCRGGHSGGPSRVNAPSTYDHDPTRSTSTLRGVDLFVGCILYKAHRPVQISTHALALLDGKIFVIWPF